MASLQNLVYTVSVAVTIVVVVLTSRRVVVADETSVETSVDVMVSVDVNVAVTVSVLVPTLSSVAIVVDSGAALTPMQLQADETRSAEKRVRH